MHPASTASLRVASSSCAVMKMTGHFDPDAASPRCSSIPAIPVVRAWRSNESILLERIAPRTYRPEAGQAIAVSNPPLLPEEVDMALKIKVREVNVFGEPPLSETGPENGPLAQAFKPSRAFPGSFGKRTASYEDGPIVGHVDADPRVEQRASKMRGRSRACRAVLHLRAVLLSSVINSERLFAGRSLRPSSTIGWSEKA